jgi:NitT/TauT family transport system substrate-binding protein
MRTTFQRLFLTGLFVLVLSSCSTPPEKLRISATTWVGYSPLFYAKAKGWLDPLNIKLLHVVSLSENMYLYQAGNADAYVGTQYEYSVMHNKKPDLTAVMMFDRSNGGDLILSNRTVDELKAATQPIKVYLEMDSINRTLIDDFMAKYGFDKSHFNFINEDQATISTVKFKQSTSPTMIVTYTPYNLSLEKKGFKQVASTRDNLDIFVVDALFTTKDVLNKHRKQFQGLKKAVARAVKALHDNPNEFYQTIKPYLLELSYQDFVASLKDIEWINDSLSPALKQRLKQAHYPIDHLL